MADTLTKAQRSERMSRIRGRDTRPELLVRRLVFSLGYRYRLHGPRLPGKPDLVFPSRRKVIFVHGCFWHRHGNPDCKLVRLPKSRLDFWLPKLEANATRDANVHEQLTADGWEVFVIWECQIKDSFLSDRIRAFLDS